MRCNSITAIKASAPGYYLGRGDYLAKARDLLTEYLPPGGKALEIGAWGLPLVKDSDVMDMAADSPVPPTIRHDARRVPWPIADRAYTIVIALQVWEHLDGHQLAAWREVRRVAQWALLSIPYLWTEPCTPGHAGITMGKFHEWTDNADPVAVVRIPATGCSRRADRLMAMFDFARL